MRVFIPFIRASSLATRAPRLVLLAALMAGIAGSVAGLPPPGRGGVPDFPESAGFPFMVRDPDMASPVSAAFLNDHKAGSLGRVTVGTDGHLQVAGRRIRFFGTNLTWLPPASQAKELARRLAFLGVNVVRFHHIDASWSGGLLAKSRGSTRKGLDPEALERLDFMVAALAEEGIYSNINLLTGREFTSADGLPKAVEKLEEFKSRHALGFWDPAALALQEDYARLLLTHRNPHTGKTYAEDPAVLLVEINNENGLLMSYKNGWLDTLDSSLTGGLTGGWNRWLVAKYRTQSAMDKALGLVVEGSRSYLEPLTVEGKPGKWNLEHHGGSDTRMVPTGDGRGLHIDVLRPGTETWHVQLNQGPFPVEAGQAVTLTFRARTTGFMASTVKLSVSLMMAHEPWQWLGFGSDAEVGPEWKEFRFTGFIPSGDPGARLNLGGLGTWKGSMEIADVELKDGARFFDPAQRIQDGSFPLPASRDYQALGTALQKDLMEYLYGLEDAYWGHMQSFLKDDLQVQALLAGTINGCSTPSLMNRFDIIDSHAYWNHPEFPARAWDGLNNRVHNRSLVREAGGGTLPELALKRMAGKPFSVSEYDHPYPNQFSAEMFPMVAAYACFQDWDMIYGFAVDGEDAVGPSSIRSYFDQLGHPLKVSAMPFAARIFRQGLLSPGATLVTVPGSRDKELDILPSSHGWNVIDGGHLGLDRSLALSWRVAMDYRPDGSSREPARAPADLPARRPGEFEGGAMVWDARGGTFTARGDGVTVALRAGERPGRDDRPFRVATDGETWTTTDGFAALMIVPVKPGDGRRLLWTGLVAGNTGEALREWEGPRRNDGRRGTAHPFELDYIGAPARPRGTRSWALNAWWVPEAPVPGTLMPLGTDGRPREAVPSGEGTGRGSLWWLLD